MFKPGNNGGGNPNHDEEGKFTSGPNKAGQGDKDYEDRLKKTIGVNDDGDSEEIEKSGDVSDGDITEYLSENRDYFDEGATIGDVVNKTSQELGIEPSQVMRLLQEEAKSFGKQIDENTNYKEWWSSEEAENNDYEDKLKKTLGVNDSSVSSEQSDYDFYNDLYNDELFDNFDDISPAGDYNEGGENQFLVFGKDNTTNIYNDVVRKAEEIANKKGLRVKVKEVFGWNNQFGPVKTYKLTFERG